MDKNLSDEKLDQILERLVKDSLPDEEMINEIADSPRLWQNVQNRIRNAKETRQKGWIPPWLTWQAAGFAAMILVFCGALLWYENRREDNLPAEVSLIVSPVKEIPETAEVLSSETPKSDETVSDPNRPPVQKFVSAQKVSPKKNLKQTVSAKPQTAKITPKSAPVKAEIKTEFIALAYSPAPESGQILKVKVPRSMMVALGVASSVENASELVNAEVLMGDDGLARAIRFVQ
jgi:hypothetical protein